MTERDVRYRELGFGVVEILIAVLLLVVAISATTMAVVGGERATGVAKVNDAMTATGRRVQEHLASNRAWMDLRPSLQHSRRAAARRRDRRRLRLAHRWRTSG